MFRTVFSLAQESKRTKTILFSMLAFFFVLCVFASVYYSNELMMGSFETFNNDDVKYLRSAQTLLDTGKLTYKYTDQPTCFIMPGIVFLCTPFVALFGMEGAVMPIRILFALLQTASLFFAFLIVKNTFNSKVGLIATLISMAYLPNIYVSTQILTEAPSYFFILLMLLFILHGTDEKKKRYFIAGGITWGLAVMFRSTLAAFPLVVFVYWLIKRYKISEMLKFGLCALIPFLVILAPWVIRNYVVFDKFVPLTYASGNPAMQGTIINYDRSRYETEILPNINVEDIDYGNSEITSNEAETELAKRIFAYNIKENTGEYIYWYTIGKTIKNLRFPFMWHPLYAQTFFPPSVAHIIFLCVAAIVAIYLMIAKKFSHKMWLLFVLFWFFNCIHLPFYAFSRYMYPAMFVPIALTAYLCSCIIDAVSRFIKQKKEKQAA